MGPRPNVSLSDNFTGPVTGQVNIYKGPAFLGVAIPGTEVQLSKEEDAWLIQQAMMLQQAFKEGHLQYA